MDTGSSFQSRWAAFSSRNWLLASSNGSSTQPNHRLVHVEDIPEVPATQALPRRDAGASGYSSLAGRCPPESDSFCARWAPLLCLASLLLAGAAAASAASLRSHAWPPRGVLEAPAPPAPWEEWEVVYRKLVDIRNRSTAAAVVIGQKGFSDIFIGRRRGGWVEVSGGGYIPIALEGRRFLARRNNSYIQLTGECETSDLYHIPVGDICCHAVTSMRLALKAVPGENVLVVNRSCRLASVPDEPLCSTKPYLEKRFATRTTTTSTATTTTATTTATAAATHSSTGTATTTTQAAPSQMFCFAVMRVGGEEEALIKAQLERKAGIWACDDAVVLSTERLRLGKNPWDEAGEDVYTWVNPSPAAPTGDPGKAGVTTSSWLNTATFIQAFDILLQDSKRRFLQYDWILKVDPDAVLLPERLRLHVQDYVGQKVFFRNCQTAAGPHLYGALEIISQVAFAAYGMGVDRCKDSLPWHGWGEDMYMEECLKLLGVRAVDDFELVGDGRCFQVPCSDATRVAFHPFKDTAAWLSCWRESGKR